MKKNRCKGTIFFRHIQIILLIYAKLAKFIKKKADHDITSESVDNNIINTILQRYEKLFAKVLILPKIPKNTIFQPSFCKVDFTKY